MFIGRTRELKSLNKAFASDSFEFFCVYGRRRVGKTALLNEFIKGKKTIFFSPLIGTQEENLVALSAAISIGLNGIPSRAVFNSFEDAFAEISQAAKEERIAFVIDEYPYIAKRYESFASLLQHTIDHHWEQSHLFLVLCGSSVSFMQNQVMGIQSPLYGRRTGQIKLIPFDWFDTSSFFQHYTLEESAIVYALTGGIPKYLAFFHDTISLSTNIVNSFFNPDHVLFEETTNLLMQEVNEAAIYNSILTSIATGSSELNKIATKSHIESSQCVYYLKALIELGIVKKEVPFGEKETSRKTIYRFDDGMFRFWYRFVYRNMSQIQIGMGKNVWEHMQQQLPDFMGEAFEQICKSYLWRCSLQNQLPFSISSIGRWWGNHPVMKSEQEIDLVATDFEEKQGIFCECKWTNEKVPVSVIETLIQRSSMFAYTQKYYFVFSKSGFTDAALQRADEVSLIELNDMNIFRS
jgi:AAA+ ATPase superfamily predicted ATPase